MSKGNRQNEIKKLRETNAALVREGEILEEKIRQLEEFNRQLQLALQNLKHQIFGRRSERLEDPRQTRLFEEELSEEARKAIERSLADQDKDKPAPRSKRNGRRPLPKHLPRKTVLLDIPAEEKTCPHGHPRRPFGEDVTEELDVIPAKFFVNEIIRPKYKTAGCSNPACQGVVMAPLPPRPIEQGRPGPGLLAHVVVSKYSDHLPLYRQAEIYKRHGVDLSRSTLCPCGWMKG
jgi:transposase